MFTFELTPKEPTPVQLKISKVELPIHGQHVTHIDDIRRLEREYKVRNLDTECVDSGSIYQTELLKTIYDASYPLKDFTNVVQSEQNVKEPQTDKTIDKTKLAFWEVYARKIIPALSAKLDIKYKKKEPTDDKRPQRIPRFTFRSFHIHAPISVIAFQRAIQRIEFNTGVVINWDWIVTHFPHVTIEEQIEMVKNPTKWIVGADGDGTLSIANLRSWKNTANVQLKTIDMIVSAETDEFVQAVLFAVLNCAIGGMAVIHIPRCSTTAAATCIHLFTQCFESTDIIHTLAEDRLFLVGIGFSKSLSTKQQKQIYDYIASDLENDAAVVDIESEGFIATLEKLIAMNATLYQWRHNYYEKMLMLHEQLSTSSSAKLFTDYIDETLAANYKDQSKKWIKYTGYPVQK